MNSNAVSIIDLARMEILNTVLLDNIDRGAADPWGVAWSADSATLLITHAGTHEISVIDFPPSLPGSPSPRHARQLQTDLSLFRLPLPGRSAQ